MQWMRLSALLAALAACALVGPAGCAADASRNVAQERMAADLADTLRAEALKLPDGGQRERLVSGLIQLRELLVDASGLKPTDDATGAPLAPTPAGGKSPAPEWAMMFAPRSLVIGFFTRSKNFDNLPGDDGLDVRIQPLDTFGDPTKAVGAYRIEAFAYRIHSGEKRGERLGHWYVSVLDAESNRKYYDPVDRSYVFPLLWDKEIPVGTTVIVQATYYPPGGFQDKLFAQRVIKVGAETD